MSPENDRDSQCCKLAHFGICFHRWSSLKKPYRQTECVGVAESGVIGYARGGVLIHFHL